MNIARRNPERGRQNCIRKPKFKKAFTTEGKKAS